MKKIDFVSMVKNTKEAEVLINYLKYRFKRGYSTLILVIGGRGTGKSSTCYRLSEIINEELNPLREKIGLGKKELGTMADSHLKFMSFVKHSELGDDCILEEISVLYPSRRAMGEENVAISKVFDIIRKKRLIIFANCPVALTADKNIRLSANVLLKTYKIIKSEEVVLSQMWKQQPNYFKGDVFPHKFTKNGKVLDFMYTKMPNKETWKGYEGDKDTFIDEEYDKLIKKAENKRDKELKELGYAPIERKPLTEMQEKVMKVRANNTGKETAEILNMDEKKVSRNKILSEKKGYRLEEFKKTIE